MTAVETAEPREVGVGTVLAGRYNLLRHVEPPKTAMGMAERGSLSPWAVYDAEHVLLGGGARIKLLRKASNQPHLRAWLLREGRALRRASHPQVPKVFDIGESETGEVYLVLDPPPANAMTLNTYLGKSPAPLEERIVLRILRQLAEILHHVHAKGVVHRGLYDGAVHVCGDGADVNVMLSAFDFADLAGDPQLATTETVFGHPNWMSPEQTRGSDVDARSDLYSLGCILYLMLARRLPFMHDDDATLLEMHRSAEPQPIRAAGTTSPLDAICLKLLAKDPNDRYPSAEALLAVLPN